MLPLGPIELPLLGDLQHALNQPCMLLSNSVKELFTRLIYNIIPLHGLI